ncbi:hypothetical protein [Streptomyces sp. A0642]|uniref:hypothetical protein n=1 Tax=Streptomyces sp. A0642 TaxID=2563100 RepID=UPI0014465226|nr:hypothetical protein [Streptomyces sp. A0642]
MTGPPRRAAAALGHRAADAAGRLGVRIVLLAFWGTASVLSRWGEGPRSHEGESVRRDG